MQKNILRNVNMDLERVLLIFMVIVLHYNNRAMGGALNYGAVGGMIEWLVRLNQSLSICAVDAFLILSGYFAHGEITVSKCIKKAIYLLVACSFYRVVGYLIYAIFVTNDFSVRTLAAYVIPSNWFVTMFVTVLLLMPFMNSFLTGLDRTRLRSMIAIMSVLFSLIPTIIFLSAQVLNVNIAGLATISLNGDIGGFTIVNFLYCYCLGFFLRRESEFTDSIPAWVYMLIYLGAALVAVRLSFMSEDVWSYSNLLTVLEAVALSLFFSKLKIKSAVFGHIISDIAGCSLGVFVWHTMPLMIYGYWVHMNIDYCGSSLWDSIICFWKSTLSMFVLSLVWVYVCRCIYTFIKQRIHK